MTTKAKAEAAETTNINRTTNRDKHEGQETPPVPEPRAEYQDDVEVHEQHVDIVMIRNVLDPHRPPVDAMAAGIIACHAFCCPTSVVASCASLKDHQLCRNRVQCSHIHHSFGIK